MIFKRKKKLTGIFEDLPVAPAAEPKLRDLKKSGRRAMLIPDGPYDPNPSADRLIANTGKQKEVWLEIIYASRHRESKQSSIATFLQENYRVQKWWANSIALMYLAWRASSKSGAESDLLRLVFVIPTTLTLSYTLMSSEGIYGASFKRFLKSVQDQKLVLTFDDETRASLMFEASESSCVVTVEHEFIKDSVSRKTRTKYWNELFRKLSEQVSR